MSDHLEFGYIGNRMRLDVPHDILQKSMARSRNFSRIINLADRHERVVEYQPGEDATRLIFRTRKAGAYPDLQSHGKLKQIVSVIEEVSERTPAGRQDPNLAVEMGTEPINNTDKYGFNAQLRWPDNPQRAEDEATRMMQVIASDVGYPGKGISPKRLVGAVLDRPKGASFIVNDIGSCTLDTDGSLYRPDDPIIELYGHNILSHEMQLICLAGLIKVASLPRDEQLQPAKQLYDEVPFDATRAYELGGWRDLPEIVHDEHSIKGFFGEYRWLSNFGSATVELDGVVYKCVEVAYQAAKHAPQDRGYFLTCTSRESIAYNREHTPTFYSAEAWDAKKVEVMKALLEQKFDPAQNPDNAARLHATGQKYIEETNWWNDTFWGKNLQGEGLNTLGRLIMEIRSHLL